MARRLEKTAALVPLTPGRDLSEMGRALRADIKAMVTQARGEFRADVDAVLTEVSQHAAEIEKAIGDLSQREALDSVRQFFHDAITRKMDRYD
jgi:hypothetical protein